MLRSIAKIPLMEARESTILARSQAFLEGKLQMRVVHSLQMRVVHSLDRLRGDVDRRPLSPVLGRAVRI